MLIVLPLTGPGGHPGGLSLAGEEREREEVVLWWMVDGIMAAVRLLPKVRGRPRVSLALVGGTSWEF